MLFKLIIGYVISVFAVYFFNDEIANLLSGNSAVIRFIELTLPLTIPSLVYFFQVSKERQERTEKENQKYEKNKKDKDDKFEKSLPYFYVRNGTVFAKNPQNAPILNVKIQFETIKDDFCILGKISTEGSIYLEHNISVGGLVDGDEIDIDNLLEGKNILEQTRWFVLSAITVTNDTIYFVYLPCVKMGWHFYRKKYASEYIITGYIGDDSYYELAKRLVVHVSKNGNKFSYKESILNDAAFCLENDDLQEALANLIILIRTVQNLPKSEILYVLHNTCLMINHLKKLKDIEYNYFKGNLVGRCDFTKKYIMELAETMDQEFMIQEYLYDIIKLVEADEKVSLDFWLRNVEVYIRDQSCILNEIALKGALNIIIPEITGGIVD